MSLLAYAIIAALIFTAGAAGGWKAHVGIIASRDLAALQAQERETLRRVDKIDKAAERHEVAKERIRESFITINERVENEVTKVEYRDAACLSDDSVRIIADSILAITPAASKPAPSVSAPRIP